MTITIIRKIALTFLVAFWISVSYWCYRYDNDNNHPSYSNILSLIKNQPLSVKNWLNLADWYHHSQEPKQRALSLEVAANLANRRAVLTKPIFHRQVVWNEFGLARSTGKNLILLDPPQAYNVFLFIKSIYGTQDFIDNILPNHSLNNNKSISKTTYLNVLFLELLKNKKLVDFFDLWTTVDEQTKTKIAKSNYMINHYQSLVRHNGYSILDSISTSAPNSLKYLGADLEIPFKANDSSNPLCWIKNIQKNVSLSTINSVLNITVFPGKNSSSTLICYLPIMVQQNTNVEISTHWSAKGFDKEQSSTLSITPVNTFQQPTTKHKRIVKSGTWQAEEINFSMQVNRNTLGVQLMLVTPKTNNKASTEGTISITPFTVNRINLN